MSPRKKKGVGFLVSGVVFLVVGGVFVATEATPVWVSLAVIALIL